MTGRDIEYLKGKKIIGAYLSQSKTYFALEFEDGTYQEFYTEGDCCSNSWVEHFTAPNDLEGGAIFYGVEEILISGEWEKDDEYGNYLQDYETRFSTSKGDIVVEFRNSSNGYYGGWLEPVDSNICRNEMIEKLAGLTKGD